MRHWGVLLGRGSSASAPPPSLNNCQGAPGVIAKLTMWGPPGSCRFPPHHPFKEQQPWGWRWDEGMCPTFWGFWKLPSALVIPGDPNRKSKWKPSFKQAELGRELRGKSSKLPSHHFQAPVDKPSPLERSIPPSALDDFLWNYLIQKDLNIEFLAGEDCSLYLSHRDQPNFYPVLWSNSYKLTSSVLAFA